MKKMKFLLVMLITILLIPYCVFAEDGSSSSDSENKVVDKQVNLYFFNGDGCGHCANAEAWFEEIEDKYGKYFNLVSYEVWYDKDNSRLMERVAELRDEEVGGVPYIIVGNQSWNGFADDYKDQIISKIKSEYEIDPAERYDIMNYVGELEEEESVAGDVIALIIIIIVAGAIVTGIVMARKKTN